MSRQQASVHRVVLVLIPWAMVLAVPASGEVTSQPSTQASQPALSFPKIDRRAPVANWRGAVLETLPHFDRAACEADPWQLDLRQGDVSGLDLRERLDDLLFASFDDGTHWPPADRLPEGFDTKQIMELGKNPGFHLRELHAQGVTGKGVGIAIIDQTLLTEHVEYADRLRFYEESPPPSALRGLLGMRLLVDPNATMHGASVASIAVGKTVGVAPEADLYYIAASLGTREGRDFTQYAKSIRRILEVNAALPANQKVRVISMSAGWTPTERGYDDIVQAAEQARKAGLLVICSSVERVHGFGFHGLGRAPLADPDSFESYGPGLWWTDRLARDPAKEITDRLLVPMDSRAVASPHSPTEYVFYRQGGWSWCIPYIAGLYALAVQTDPTMTPDRFWELALRTGTTIQVTAGETQLPFGAIANPPRLIEAIREVKR